MRRLLIGLLLFFMLTSLVRINSLYMFSLASFVIVFERAIDKTVAHEDDDEERRLAKLIENITYSVWHFTRRGLFEKHKLTLCTQLLILTMKRAGKLDLAELEYLMLSPQALEYPPVPDNIKSWMSEAMWARVHHLKTVEGFAEVANDITNNPKSVKSWKAWCEDEKAEKSDNMLTKMEVSSSSSPLPRTWRAKTCQPRPYSPSPSDFATLISL